MSALEWAALGAVVWSVLSVRAALILGRVLRGRNQQIPVSS